MHIQLTNNQLSTKAYYDQTINHSLDHGPHQIRLFAVNGFELCPLEQHYRLANQDVSDSPEALKVDWFRQDPVSEGIVLNHSFLLWRCGYQDLAAHQLDQWAQHWPIYHKVRQIKPKWGLDFSIESVSRTGTVFEILHFEHDFFEYPRCYEMQLAYQQLFVSADWLDLAQRVYRRRHEWEHLGFFAQSRWKCEFFGVVPENFGQTIWHLV